jgi:hypothetical protein
MAATLIPIAVKSTVPTLHQTGVHLRLAMGASYGPDMLVAFPTPPRTGRAGHIQNAHDPVSMQGS